MNPEGNTDEIQSAEQPAPPQNENSASETHTEVDRVEEQKNSCGKCATLEMDLEALRSRNKAVIDNFSIYRSSVDRELSSKDAEIERLNCSLQGQQTEIASLREAISKLTEQLSGKDMEQVRLNSSLASLRDELEAEKTKNSQISAQFLSLQFKLAQEKATKTIKSTAASISSSIKSISQELFSRKTDTVVLNEGYSQFVARYESDMAHIEKTVRELETNCQKILEDWRASEEEHKKHAAELTEENRQIRQERNELEASLRSTIQSLEAANQDLNDELVQVRVEYKVSDQAENDAHIHRLQDQIHKLEDEKSAIEQASASKEEKAAAVQKSLQEALQRECERTKCFERQLMSIEDADVTKQREEEQKRVVDQLAQWVVDEQRYDSPGYGLDDVSVTSLFAMWRTDEQSRQTAMEWMTDYMSRTSDAEKSELILTDMPFEVYEGFAQIVIPILQSRDNSTLKFYKRQGLHFDMKLSVGEVEKQTPTPEASDATAAGDLSVAGGEETSTDQISQAEQTDHTDQKQKKSTVCGKE